MFYRSITLDFIEDHVIRRQFLKSENLKILFCELVAVTWSSEDTMFLI